MAVGSEKNAERVSIFLTHVLMRDCKQLPPKGTPPGQGCVVTFVGNEAVAPWFAQCKPRDRAMCDCLRGKRRDSPQDGVTAPCGPRGAKIACSGALRRRPWSNGTPGVERASGGPT